MNKFQKLRLVKNEEHLNKRIFKTGNLKHMGILPIQLGPQTSHQVFVNFNSTIMHLRSQNALNTRPLDRHAKIFVDKHHLV
jgi:hypothetical protein